MAQIDTSMYRRAPSAYDAMSGIAQNIGSYSDSMRQNKLSDLSMRQSEFNLSNSQREAQIREDKIAEAKRLKQIEEQKRQEFMAQYQTAQMEGGEQLSPEAVQEIYANVYPEKYAQQQMKNPMAMLEYERKMEAQKLSKERLSLQKDEAKRRIKKDSFMEDYRNKTLKWKSKNYDRGVYEYETSLAEKIRDQDWTESAPEREQLQLLAKITPELQKFKKAGKRLDTIEVRKINEGTSATGNLLSLTGELTRMVKKDGLQRVKGAKKAKMDSAVRSIATSLNSQMFVNSGVMSQGEFDNMKAMVGDPTEWTNLTEGEVNARMESLQNFVKSKYVNTLEAYGIEGEKAYKAIRLKTNNFFNKNSARSALTSEDEGLIRR